jgi:ParB-like chromosome segregation protein Spo0J
LRSVADIDFSKLTPRAKDAMIFAEEIAERGCTYEELASEHGTSRRSIAEGLELLREEVAALSGEDGIPDLSEDEYEALRADIGERGQLVPILVDGRGRILDGKHRKRACTELGIPVKSESVDVENEDEGRALAIAVNVARRQLSNDQRRKIVFAELLRDSERSDRTIAAKLGVTHPTVASARRELVDRGLVENLSTRVDATGRAQPATKPERQKKKPERGPELMRVDAEIVTSPTGKLVQIRIAEEYVVRLVERWVKCSAIKLEPQDDGTYSLLAKR